MRRMLSAALAALVLAAGLLASCSAPPSQGGSSTPNTSPSASTSSTLDPVSTVNPESTVNPVSTVNPSPPTSAGPSVTLNTSTNVASVEAEEYAVYSALIEERFGGARMIVIRDHTAGGLDQSWKDSVDGFRSNLRGLQDPTIDSFKANNQRSFPLKQKFELRVPYAFISEEDVQEIFQSSDGWDRFYELYPDSQGDMTLSRVGFNATRDQALVYIGNQSHWLAGEGNYFLCTKVGGRWKISADMMVWIS